MAMPVCAAQAGDAEVVDVRVAMHQDGTTRFVLELSEAVPFSVSPMPGGVAIDTPALDWRSRAAGLLRPVGLINGFTYATPKPGSGRVLLYTVPTAAVQKAFAMRSEMGGAYRLVVDLAAQSATTAAAAAVAPAPAPIPVPPPRPLAPVNDNPLLGHGGPVQSVAMAVAPDMPPPDADAQSAAAEERAARERRHDPHKPLIVIDAGHGGIDPGTTGLSGEHEKDIVLALALALKQKLERDGKVLCVLTREDDTFIPLQERVAIARAAKADLFMSLHADSEADPDIRGLSVYTLSKTASDATAQALADKENQADLVAGLNIRNANPEVTNILIDLVQRETLNLSATFARLIIDETGREIHLLDNNTHRFAGFAVLKAPDVPSVLVETGYLSNKADEQLLRRPDYRAKLAALLARAVERYFARNAAARRG